MSKARDSVEDLRTIDADLVVARAGRKNLIINGGFDVWQRGTSFTTSAEYTADRWQLQLSGGTSTATQQTFTVGQTEVPDNPTYYLKMNTTTGDNNCGMFHRVEDVRNGAGQNVTVSFWAKGTNPAGGTFDLILSQKFDGSATLYDDTPLTITSSWVKYTHTFTAPSISGKTIGTNSSLDLIIRQAAGDTSTTAWNLNMAQVQLELGSVATDFEHRSYGEELALCQRYYEIVKAASAWTWTHTTGARIYGQFKTEKRASPSVSGSPINIGNGNAGYTQSSFAGPSTTAYGFDGFCYYFTPSLITTRSYTVFSTLYFDAEL